MAFVNPYPPIAVGIQVLVLATELFGILANIFFLYMLLRYHRGWHPGKMLLLAFHVAALVFLMSLFFPLIVVVSTGRDLTTAECEAPASINQGATVALPVSLGAAAQYRWKDIQRSLSNEPSPNVKHYLCFLLAFVAVTMALGAITFNDEAAKWDGPFMLCIRPSAVYGLILYLTFFITAPYVFYCYRKILSAIRENGIVNDGVSKIVRAIYILVVFIYVAYFPRFVILIVGFLANAASISNTTYQILQWINITHTAFSSIVSIMTIPRYRATAVSILKCQTGGMVGSAKKLSTNNSKQRSTKSTSACPPTPSVKETTTDPDTGTPMNEAATSAVTV